MVVMRRSKGNALYRPVGLMSAQERGAGVLGAGERGPTFCPADGAVPQGGLCEAVRAGTLGRPPALARERRASLGSFLG